MAGRSQWLEFGDFTPKIPTIYSKQVANHTKLVYRSCTTLLGQPSTNSFLMRDSSDDRNKQPAVSPKSTIEAASFATPKSQVSSGNKLTVTSGLPR